jgi:hypothetical protein
MADYVRDYSKGKVYKIVVDTDKEYKPYVGSTIEELSRRMAGHRGKYKQWKKGKGNKCNSFYLFDKFGVDKCKIILLEEYPCENISQLLAKEREWFDKMECCNELRPYRTDEEIIEYKKEWYETNKEQILEQKKEYYNTHKEELAKKSKIYRHENKEEIAEKRKEKFTCKCGAIICKYEKPRHERSQKHISFISQN